MKRMLCMILVFMTCVPVVHAPSTDSTNVILISWDGVQRAHLYDMLEGGRLPNLGALVREGGIADLEVKDHATDTKAGHAEMLSGYPPRVTGVYNNRNFRPIPKGFTIFERLETNVGGGVVTVMLAGKTHHVGGERGEPFFKAKKYMDVFDSNAAPADVVGPKALDYLEKYADKRAFFFFHFSDPDSAGHAEGENSREYEDAIVACDEWLGRIVDGLHKRGVYENTILYVTSDHGFDEGGTTHMDAPFVFVASNRLVGAGDQKDIVPTVLSDYGIATNDIRPRLPGTPLRLAGGRLYPPPTEEEVKEIYRLLPKEFSCPSFNVVSTRSEGEISISEIEYTSEGLKIRGMMFRPENGGRHPLLMLNHGGGWGIKEKVERWGMMFASEGYVVLASSYRGEDGSEGIVELGRGEVADILTLAECGKRLPFVDASLLAIVGSSHGGLNTLLACEVYDFDACVDLYGITDFLDSTLRDNLSFDVIERAYRKKSGHAPSREELRLECLLRSPLYLARYMKTPLLILHGSSDALVPVDQSRRLMLELEKYGKAYEYKIYEGAPHGFNYLREYEEETFRIIVSFLERFVE